MRRGRVNFVSKSAEKFKKTTIKKNHIIFPQTNEVQKVLQNAFLDSKVTKKGNRFILVKGKTTKEFDNLSKFYGYNLVHIEDINNYFLNILQCSCFLFLDTFDDAMIKFINFASNYSIPLMWINKYVIPEKWIWSFDTILIGEYSNYDIWSELCEIKK